MNRIKSTELCDAFKSMDKDSLNDAKFLSKFIIENVGLSLNPYLFKGNEERLGDVWRGLKTKQYPDELGKYLQYIYQNRDKINSYMEVGVDHGGTFFVVDSFLRSIKDNYGGGFGIDIDPRLSRHFGDYISKYPDTRLELVGDVYNIELNKVYDLCFIDAVHSYEGIKKDYERYWPYCNILSMHDIKLMPRKGKNSVKEYWEEIKTDESIELLNEDDRFVVDVGIGILNP